MSVLYKILLFSIIGLVGIAAVSCGGQIQPATPVETFKTYVKALKKKDYTTVKLLLSNATLKMHEQQAKAQNTTVDDIIKNESLIGDNQKEVNYRNEKIDGDKATIEVQNSYGMWQSLPLIKEDGVWKIDKAGYAQQIMNDVDDNEKIFDQLADPNNHNPAPTPVQ